MPEVATALTALVASVCLLGLPALPASAQLTTQGAKAPKLVLEGWPNENEGAIYVANADGSNLKRVTPFPAGHPAWSPDRRRIAFAGSFGRCSPCDSFIYISAADGTKRKKLGPAGSSPRWSPTGRKLVYTFGVGGRIATINADGSGKKVIRLGVEAEQPEWSPDGHRFAFVVPRPQENGPGGAIYVADIDGSHVRQLTTKGSSYDPRWSPDGKKIRFVQSRNLAHSQAFFEISPDGSRLHRLAFVPGQPQGEVWVETSTWTANGRHVYYCDGSGAVVVLNIRTHVLRAISRVHRYVGCEALDVR